MFQAYRDRAQRRESALPGVMKNRCNCNRMDGNPTVVSFELQMQSI